MDILQSQVNPQSPDYQRNVAHNLEQMRLLRERLQSARDGGGAQAIALHRRRGKLLVRERIEALLDPGALHDPLVGRVHPVLGAQVVVRDDPRR